MLERTRARVREADAMVAEAEAARQLASLPAPRAGETGPAPPRPRARSAAGPSGRSRWRRGSRRSSSSASGGALPVSAFGQTAVHDRLGFDHRDALDVAVHPDSPEGEAVMAWLREHGVSFLAFRGPVAGEATGAHVHVGDPSPRLAARPR